RSSNSRLGLSADADVATNAATLRHARQHRSHDRLSINQTTCKSTARSRGTGPSQRALCLYFSVATRTIRALRERCGELAHKHEKESLMKGLKTLAATLCFAVMGTVLLAQAPQ